MKRCTSLSPRDASRCYKDDGHTDSTHKATATGIRAIYGMGNEWTDNIVMQNSDTTYDYRVVRIHRESYDVDEVEVSAFSIVELGIGSRDWKTSPDLEKTCETEKDLH